MNKVKRIILKTILVITAVLGIYLMFFQTKGTEKPSREDEAKIRQEHYEKGCQKLALWTVQHYSGIKSIEFLGFNNYGEGGNVIHAYLNNENTIASYWVENESVSDNKVIDFDLSTKSENVQNGIVERYNAQASLSQVKVKIGKFNENE